MPTSLTTRRLGPLVARGTPAAHALSLANRTAGIRQVFQRTRRRIHAVYGRDADPVLMLLLDRYEERLEGLEVTAEALRDHLLMHAPAPHDHELDGQRLCANPACRAPLYGRKSTTLTCGAPCRTEVSRLRRAGLLPAEGAGASRWTRASS